MLGEIALVTLVAIPPGWALGIVFSRLLNQAFSNDMFRIPLVLTPQAFGIAAGGVLVASLLVGIMLVRRLNRLNMVSSLKASA
nr:FtsX-like permease family protein [Halomonas sp. G15]